MKTGLTPFLAALMKAPREALTRADPAKLAAKYGIPTEWAKFYITDWMAR
ncbi:MAG: hypothetical protein JWR85_3577 [Marmoricola sp.]|nr:hypothetical protein [Marmoricola sp.]